MSDELSFKDLVLDTMSVIINAHNLVLIPISGHEVVLKSASYALDIFSDRDGVSIVYFDTEANPVVGFNLMKFLINRRLKLLAPDEIEPVEN